MRGYSSRTIWEVRVTPCDPRYGVKSFIQPLEGITGMRCHSLKEAVESLKYYQGLHAGMYTYTLIVPGGKNQKKFEFENGEWEMGY